MLAFGDSWLVIRGSLRLGFRGSKCWGMQPGAGGYCGHVIGRNTYMPLPWDRACAARHTVAAAKVHDLVPAPRPTSRLIGIVCSGWHMMIPGGQEQLRGNDYSGCGVPGGARTPGPGLPASGRVCMSPPPAALRCCRWDGALQPTAWAVPTLQHPGLAGHGSTLRGQLACRAAHAWSATIQKGL